MVEGRDHTADSAAAAGEEDHIDFYRLASWWTGLRGDRLLEKGDWEEIPSHLNTVNSSGGFNAVSTDKLSVQYSGVHQHGHDVGAVQANCPAPTQKLFYYFEMTVKNAGVKEQVSIGFTPHGVKLCRQPGWEPNTCGYHGDDGFIYLGSGKGESFGPKFTSGDTVGAGINYASQKFFFTKNGEKVGRSVPKNIKAPLFPTIAVHSQNEEVSVNFGRHPFVFNIEAYELEERQKQQSVIDKIPLSVNLSHGVVRSYLLHYGYEDTLNSFDIESRNALPPVSIAQEDTTDKKGDMFALNHRKILRQLIRNGDIDSVFGKLQEWYPQALQNEMSTVFFLLHTQRFIEYIRCGNLEDAVKYAGAQLVRFFDIESFQPLIQDCIALLAYENPSTSCLAYLISLSHREVVADAVNVMVLSTNLDAKDSKGSLSSHLEKLLRQLTACCFEMRSLNGDQGETFQLHKVLYGIGKRSKR